MRVDDPFGEGRCNSTGEVEHEKTTMAHGVFDIVPENPEVKHVAAKVQKTSMQKHRGDQAQPGPWDAVHGLRHRGIEEVAGNKAERKKERLPIALAEHQLPKESDDAGEDDPPGHDRREPRRVFIPDWNHLGTRARRSIAASSHVSPDAYIRFSVLSTRRSLGERKSRSGIPIMGAWRWIDSSPAASPSGQRRCYATENSRGNKLLRKPRIAAGSLI